ncbi:MAG TPA: class II glutamine amidotransferase [Flexivirga sp.]|uniref:class II glutamine amidotransferase n=1 Tax=Flexivirga sp. TaxID=1962927 RepID=UPI002C75AC8C|nr:class II glutamine amidotransferase [Flexivirga sp.]HWC22553.1 class II glutamine amidotransferase [Flexivirga sp.]
MVTVATRDCTPLSANFHKNSHKRSPKSAFSAAPAVGDDGSERIMEGAIVPPSSRLDGGHMCRLLGWSSDRPVTVAELLGDLALERLQELATVHAHGYGMAWYAEGDAELHAHRSALAAGEDGDFKRFVHETPTRRGLLHLRLATPGLGLDVVDTHPFVAGEMAFAHNGAIFPHDRVDLLLPPGAPQPAGTTDSERYFARLRSNIGRKQGGAAVARAAGRVLSRMRWHGMSASSLNALLLTRHELHLISLHDPEAEPADVQVWPADYTTHPPYLDLSLLQRDGLSVVASSGILREETGVTRVDAASVVSLNDHGGVARVSQIPERIVSPLRRSA